MASPDKSADELAGLDESVSGMEADVDDMSTAGADGDAIDEALADDAWPEEDAADPAQADGASAEAPVHRGPGQLLG